MSITTKQFQLLTDINLIWNFMVETYDRDNRTGVAAPFFEYAITSAWMDTSYQFLNRIWFDGDKVVAFVFNESPVTDIYFNVRPGYEFLAEELVGYAMNHMLNFDGNQQFMLFNGQEFLMEEAKKRGFALAYDYESKEFDFEKELNFLLPVGFHFVDSADVDPIKLAECCWYGFNHGEKSEFKDWDKYDNSLEWTPEKAYKGNLGCMLSPSPHATPEYDVIIANEKNEYVCYSGMWWVPENKLAYMEPLCTVPEYRRKGLAAAALAKHYHTLKPLGATHMTGGGDPFYEKIGYGKGLHWYCWKRTDC